MKSLSSIKQITGALLAGVNSAIEFERENQILNKTEKVVTKIHASVKVASQNETIRSGIGFIKRKMSK